jgi:positive regulator of sigma E activity
MAPRYQLIAEGSAAGLLFLLSPLCGYFLGKWLGQLLGWGSVLGYAGAILGLVAAFLHLFKLVARVSGR